VDEAIDVVNGLYVHLPDKVATYDLNLVDDLRKLKLDLDKGLVPDFHKKMFNVFKSARDLHAAYLPPLPLKDSIAFLPFQAEEYLDKEKQRRYVVSNINEGLPWFAPCKDFVPGVEITEWNGAPISKAVQESGEEHPGGNEQAKRALGIDRLTARPLAKSPVPDEEAVTVTYIPKPGAKPCTFTVDWHVAKIEATTQPEPRAELWRAMAQGLDDGREVIRHLRRTAKRLRTGMVAPPVVPGLPELPEHCEARVLNASSVGEYGYIRIRSFKVANHRSYLTKFAKLLAAMPPEGLVIDVRDNPGGFILAAERLLQLLTPKTIQPATTEFRSTAISEGISKLVPEFFDWNASIVEDLKSTVAQGPSKSGYQAPKFSERFPVSPETMCNNVGQRYYGPVVLVTNALSYRGCRGIARDARRGRFRAMHRGRRAPAFPPFRLGFGPWSRCFRCFLRGGQSPGAVCGGCGRRHQAATRRGSVRGRAC
jgi:hypothetical protein